jgi:hypothetical protein
MRALRREAEPFAVAALRFREYPCPLSVIDGPMDGVSALERWRQLLFLHLRSG